MGAIMAIPGAGVAKGGRGIFNIIKTGASRATTSPFAGAKSVSDILKITAGRAGGVVTTAAGGAAIRSALTGDPYAVSLRKVGLGALGFGIGGVPGAIVGGIGATVSETKKGYKTVSDLLKEQIPNNNYSPIPWVNYTPDLRFPETKPDKISLNFNTPSEIGGLGLPAGPSAVFAPSFNSGFSGGIGGGGDFAQMLLLTALAGGGAGYLLGRKKKRKRKKYKRAKRRK